jgi:magnesium transporter
MILNEIRQKTEKFSLLHYIYVIDKNGVLKGVIKLHELLLADLNMPVFKFMTQNPVVVYPQTSAEMALRRMIKYKIFALPVVDERKRIIGIVSIDDLSKSIIK